MRQLEALLIAADQNELLIISGTGEVIDPDDGIAAIGSGGMYALLPPRLLNRIQICLPGKLPVRP